MATKLSVYQGALRLFGDARLDVITDDVESRYAMDDAWDSVVAFCLRAAPWRFALDLQPLVAGPQLIPGFAISYPRPVSWLRTHSLFIMSGAHELPVDMREYETTFHSNAEDVLIRFVSSAFGDPAVWPENFTKAAEAYLAFQVADRLTNSAQAGVRMSQLFGTLMQEAVLRDAQPEDPWLRFQLDGTLLRGMEYVLGQGYWAHATKTIEFSAPPVTAPPVTIPGFFPPTPPLLGYPYSYPRPLDMMVSHAFYVPAGDGRENPVDFKETAEAWSTYAPYAVVRYISTDLGMDPARIPEPFWMTLRAYLEEGIPAPAQPRQPGQPIPASKYEMTLAAALATDGESEAPFYRFQRSGAFVRACFHCAETGRWKFAINTLDLEADAWLESTDVVNGQLPANVYGDGSISPSYSAVFHKPNDWLRTIWVYRIESHTNPGVDLQGWPERQDIDYRDEGNNIHTNWRRIQMRYIRRAAIESWRWPQSYADAVLAWLEFDEARQDPAKAQVAAAKRLLYEDAIRRAEKIDDEQERPPYRKTGRIVRGRFYRSRGVGAQDWPGRF